MTMVRPNLSMRLSLAAVAMALLLSRPASSFAPHPTVSVSTPVRPPARSYTANQQAYVPTSISSSAAARSQTPPAHRHQALLDPYLLETAANSASSYSSLLSADAIESSADSIKTAFSVATFLPQPFWLFLILLPNAGITKKLFGDLNLITVFCLVHFFIVVTSILEPGGTAPMAEFNDVFDPSGDPQAAMIGMMRYPNFVSEEWSHVLTWDLFVGRAIWLDGIKRGIFTSHSVLLCNLIGPPGLLLHLATCLVTGKGLPPSEVPDNDDENDA